MHWPVVGPQEKMSVGSSCSFAWAVVKGYQSLDGLHSRNVLSHWLEVQAQRVGGIGSF